MNKQTDDLIPREILFGNPDKVNVQLSDDSKFISYIAPKEGVLNIWIAPVDNIKESTCITNDNRRGIRSYNWSKDHSHIIYSQDTDGNENTHLFSVNIKTLVQKALTPKQVRSSMLKLSNRYPHEILVLMNNRVPEYFDIYKINIQTGERNLVFKNLAQYSTFLADEDFILRFGYKMLPSGEGEIYSLEDPSDYSKTKLFQKIAVEDMITSGLLHISSNKSKLFLIDSKNRNTSALVEVDLRSGARNILYSNEKADIDDYILEPKSKLVQAVAANYLRKEWVILDPAIEKDIEYLRNIEEGDFEILSRSYEDDKWIVAFLKSDEPVKYYLYNRTKKAVEFLFFNNERQVGLAFAEMHPLKIKSRDGLDLICYLTLPGSLKYDSADAPHPLPTQPVPLILNVHGGPNVRDRYGFNPTSQWLANRGYGVLNVNYRGSTGFGKDFINAGDGKWAREMQYDLEDAVNYCIEHKITERDKVVIMGGSYGGYAALVGMSMTPDLYAAGIDIVGPSNLETLINSIPPYWKPQAAHLTKMIGATTNTEAGRKYLKERSPLTYAHNIKKPLLIIQGANDPRVKQAESDQIVAVMKKHSIPVVYLLYPDEGHGLARPENRLSMYAHAEIFLANFVGGRFAPHENEFPGSSIIVQEGKDITWTTYKS